VDSIGKSPAAHVVRGGASLLEAGRSAGDGGREGEDGGDGELHFDCFGGFRWYDWLLKREERVFG